MVNMEKVLEALVVVAKVKAFSMLFTSVDVDWLPYVVLLEFMVRRSPAASPMVRAPSRVDAPPTLRAPESRVLLATVKPPAVIERPLPDRIGRASCRERG